MKDKKDKIYYFQEKSNDILDLQDELTVEEIGIYFILKAGYFKYSGELRKENANQRCKFFGDIEKFNLMISKLFDQIDGLLVNKSWLSEINGIKALSEKRKEIAESRWKIQQVKKENKPIGLNPLNPDQNLDESILNEIKLNEIKQKEIKPKSKLFIKPSIDEIKNYCFERKNNVNPEKFYDYYEARGWKLKTGAIKDWKACVRTWEGNDFKTISTNSSQTFYKKTDDLDYYDNLINHNNGGKNGI